MADSTDMPSSSKIQKVRGVTMMRKIQKVQQTGIKLKDVEFDATTWNCYGKDATTFKSYLAFLARSNCSILKDEWKDVDIDEKNRMWADMKSHFEIPVIHENEDKDPLRKAWFQFAGDRWRGFKTQLTREYITKPKKGRDPPYVRYSFIKEAVWKQFLASRDTPAFKEKSQKGRERVAKNCHPHRLSRGGYDLLTKNMMAEKRLLKDSTMCDGRSPSPPPRHERWKRARQTKDGKYTSPATQAVAEKIDSLVEDTEKGNFVPIGRDDILTNAIGKAEHGGQVRGAGRGSTISNFFGRAARASPNTNVTKQLSELETKLRADFEEKLVVERKLMQQIMMETLQSIGFSQTVHASPYKQVVEECSPTPIVNASVKASCSAAVPNMKVDFNDDSDSVTHLLCMIVKRKKYLPIKLEHDARVTNFKMSPKYMKDLLVGDKWLDFSILQLWCTYMHRLSIQAKNLDLYAFLDPTKVDIGTKKLSIQKACKEYILEQLRDLKKECYLAPYLYSGHWQLIIMCPKDNILVCLCSLHKKINEVARNVFTDAFTVHQLANGNRKKPTWIFPKTRVQPNGNDCGYYVMKNMIDIVSASITKSWMEVFNDPTELTEDELYELRNQWATCFLELYNPNDDYDDVNAD